MPLKSRNFDLVKHCLTLIFFIFFYLAHEFYECARCCTALHRLQRIRLPHIVPAHTGSRKRLLPWRSLSVMFGQTSPGDTWQRAFVAVWTGPANVQTRVRASSARARLPARLMRRFLRLFVSSQTGG